MAWPDSPFTTFVNDTPPAIDADTLDAIQAAIGDLWGSRYGDSRFGVGSDFTNFGSGSALVITSFPTQVEGLTLLGDAHAEMRMGKVQPPADGDMGILSLMTVDGNASINGAQCAPLGLGTRDYLATARAAVESKAHLDTVANIGFTVGVFGTNGGYFVAGNDAANFKYKDAGGTLHDTGIPVVDGQRYRFKAQRIGGSVYASIDNSIVYSGSDSVNMSGAYVGALVAGLAWAAHNVYASIDYLHIGPVLRP